MARKRKKPNKLPVIYKDSKVRIVYVSRSPEELFPEAVRIYSAVQVALRHLHLLRRSPHAAIHAAEWQLANVVAPPAWATTPLLVDYISTTSYLMEDTLNILATIKHSTIEELQQARFLLTYGQTPKKRDRDDTMCTKKKRPVEDVSTDD